MRLLFAPHNRCLAAIDIPEARLLLNLAALVQHFRLPLDLVLDRILHELEGVDILQLDLRAEFLLPQGTQGEVRLAAETAFVHIAVADFEIHENIPEALQIGHHFVGGTHVRFGHNFQQRRSGPIQIHPAAARSGLVHVLSGVFFQVRPPDPHALPAVAGGNLDPSLLADRRFVLGNLIALRQIGIEVVLARKPVVLADRAIQRKTGANGHFDGSLVDDRQGPG